MTVIDADFSSGPITRHRFGEHAEKAQWVAIEVFQALAYKGEAF